MSTSMKRLAVSSLARRTQLATTGEGMETPNMTSNSVALEGFLAEHGRCWRISREDLETWQDSSTVLLTCPGYGAFLGTPEDALGGRRHGAPFDG